ncbi:hypothetical protein ACHAPU_006882 [Fusarium lateritium]
MVPEASFDSWSLATLQSFTLLMDKWSIELGLKRVTLDSICALLLRHMRPHAPILEPEDCNQVRVQLWPIWGRASKKASASSHNVRDVRSPEVSGSLLHLKNVPSSKRPSMLLHPKNLPPYKPFTSALHAKNLPSYKLPASSLQPEDIPARKRLQKAAANIINKPGEVIDLYGEDFDDNLTFANKDIARSTTMEFEAKSPLVPRRSTVVPLQRFPALHRTIHRFLWVD